MNQQMNQFGLYFATVLLLVFYAMLITGSVRGARNTKLEDSNLTLADFIFSAGDSDRALFYTISIGFPFLITALPWLIEIPRFDSPIPRFMTLLGVMSNYLVVIITVEVGLMYAVPITDRKWRDRLLVVIILDVMSYIFLALTKARIDLNERLADVPSSPNVPSVLHFDVSVYSFIFFALTGFASFIASLIVVLAITKLGGKR